uniref:uncharacterized protein LOC122597413 n=1 Tax=Erigeron canadensis TaxID=72917 RepID=UPI001CB971AA|nr:uncharacterized protein LOC122597413 [Erigeron canadensis]
MSFSLRIHTYSGPLLSDDDSDEELMAIMKDCIELDEAEPSQKLTREPVYRDRYGTADQLMIDYFIEDSTFAPHHFRRRFRMRKNLFMRIIRDIQSYFLSPKPRHFTRMEDLRVDARKRLVLVPSINVYLPYDNWPEYLRRPTPDDIQRLLGKHEELHGFPGMLESIDWQYTRGDKGRPTIILEAVASYDLWIWHAYFGAAGSNNDINVLNQSNLFREIIEDTAPDTPFNVNGTEYKKTYYLADDIYPEWSMFVKSFSCSQDEKRKKFKKYQESARKDVEREFGVLQGRWEILQAPAEAMSVNKIRRTMYACVMLHNMIVEDSRYAITSYEENFINEPRNLPRRTFEERLKVHERTIKELRDRHVHHSLRHDLVEHIWSLP